jgi:hypothetical protein
MNYLRHAAVLTANENTAVISLLTHFTEGDLLIPTHNVTFVVSQNQLRELGKSFIAEAEKMTTLPTVETQYDQKEVQS